MKYISVCSGIEAATVAWHSLGWQAAAYSEIEPFPSAVLAHHYPDVPNVGDMTKYKEWNIEPGSIDLLVGGTPCQSFSVAGLRKGLADPRGNLALVYCGILDHLKPRWFVWENVPGVLSSGGGRDFGSLLGAVAELGYGFAYRVLDAQYFGVAQRRRRVFVVGYLGDWRPAAKILFERESLRGDSAPSRKAGKAVARCITRGSGGGQRYDGETETFVTHSLRGEGFDASEDGTGRGTPLVPVAFHPTQDPISSAEVCHSIGANENATAAVMQPIPLNSMNALRDADADPSTGCGIGKAGEAMFTITKGHSHAVAHSVLAPTLTASNDPSRSPQSSEITAQVAAVAATTMQVRRLTPVECERLQGFPDNYTAIPWRKKPTEDCPDGPRYKALGNSMAVPVMAWIGKRIQQQEA